MVCGEVWAGEGYVRYGWCLVESMSIVGICHVQRHLACGRESDATKVILSGLFANLRMPCLIEGRCHIHIQTWQAHSTHTQHTNTLHIPHLATPQKKKSALELPPVAKTIAFLIVKCSRVLCISAARQHTIYQSVSQLVIRSFTQLASQSVMQFICTLYSP